MFLIQANAIFLAFGILLVGLSYVSSTFIASWHEFYIWLELDWRKHVYMKHLNSMGLIFST